LFFRLGHISVLSVPAEFATAPAVSTAANVNDLKFRQKRVPEFPFDALPVRPSGRSI